MLGICLFKSLANNPIVIEMKTTRSVVIIFCLILTNMCMASYALFVEYFQSGYEVKHQILQLKKNLTQAQLQKKIVEHQLLDLEQSVATVLPAKKQMIAERWNTRALHMSDQLRSPASINSLDLTEVLFERGKKFFTQGKFSAAYREFENIRDQFPSSDR